MDTVSLPNDKQDAGIEGFPLRIPPAEGGPVEQPPLLGGADLRHVDRLPRRPWFGSCRSQGRTTQQRLLRAHGQDCVQAAGYKHAPARPLV